MQEEGTTWINLGQKLIRKTLPPWFSKGKSHFRNAINQRRHVGREAKGHQEHQETPDKQGHLFEVWWANFVNPWKYLVPPIP